MTKARKLTGVKIHVQKSLQTTLSSRLKRSMENRTVDHPMLKASCVWEKTSDQLKDIVGEQIHRQWFQSIIPTVMMNNVLILECKNQFQARWLQTHYQILVDLLLSFQDKKLSSFFVSQSEKKHFTSKT